MRPKIIYILVFFLLVVELLGMQPLWAQQPLQLKGRVTDSSTGETIPGVSITEKGTSNGTSTDENGTFNLSVTAGASIIFTAVGYDSREFTPTEELVNISLSSASNQLDEIVIVGASIKKGDLTGAVTSIDSRKLSELPVTGVNQAMEGRLPGVLIQSNPRPGGNASIRVRGNNSIQYGGNPIYVVDGLIIEDAINTINPDDISSIDVLRDASATALYGSRGANGVIVITTKKGQGEGQVNYNGWYGVQEFSRMVPYMGAQDIFNLRLDAFANQYMDNNPDADREAYIDQLLSDDSEAFADYEFETYRSRHSYNWLDEITRTGNQQNHSLNFSKGSETGSVYLGLNFTDQVGLVKNSSYKRYGGQVNIDQDIKPWLKVGTSTSVTRTEEELLSDGVFNIAANANPLLAINDEMNYLRWANVESTDLYNPLRSLRIDGKNFLNRVMTTNYISLQPIEGLTVRSNLSVDLRNQQTYWYTPKDIGESLRNSTEGTANHRKDETLYWQWDNTVTYDKTINEKHNLSSLLSMSASKQNYNYNQINALGFATDDFSYKYLSGAFLRDRFELGSDFTTYSLLSYIGRVNYNYASKYYATLTARYDGSSRFGPNNKWGLFPSLALAWNIAEEAFFNKGIVNLLKVRAGYGIAGNQNIPDFAFRSLYRPVYSNNSVTYVSDGRLGNEDLRWEKQKQLNIGLDAAILNDRFSFSFDYFHINNDDLLMQRTLSLTSGFSNTIANVGALQNKGLEFVANAAILTEGDLKWNFSANISSYKNRITKLYGDVTAIYNQGGFTGVEIQREGNLFLGESINNIFVYQFDKIAQVEDMERVDGMDLGGRTVRPGDILPLDRDGNGVVDENDRFVVGNKDPKFYGGFSTDLTYKGLSVNAVFSYNYGAKALSYLYEGLMGGSGMYASHDDMNNRWTPENTNTNIPRAFFGGGRYGAGDTDWSVQDASFLRLNALTLSYTFNSSLTQRYKLNNLRVYTTASNLFTITKYKGYDPTGGDDYPMARMFVFGLNLGF
ncbi:TonB-dependent receptor [Olivibacter sp. SDN3]|uniref:SusC/RagA family TonB-linked outer membrane protein n=1 Tax=Olivibacter sp. SDN3 TaxID=2764720 RepID=UPI0016511B4A|nr:TonB-dependent receptor [Olivibacter sp. SDN3]QNL49558.1 TonB-dependent receptor [Olivibacter sp. SDN3]